MFNKKIYMRGYMRQYRKNNPEYEKKYREENPSMFLESSRKWRKNNPGYSKEWYENNKEKWLEYNERKRGKDPEYQKKWFKNNPEKVRIYIKLRTKKRSLNLKSNLNCKISTMIRNSLKGNKKGRHWETLVGYTINNLIQRLKKTIPNGYNWEDVITGELHIDHIIPIKAFNFKTSNDEEFKQCWSLYNLRLLTAKQNLLKNDSIDNPILLGLLLKETI